jgi:transposase-like protein
MPRDRNGGLRTCDTTEISKADAAIQRPDTVDVLIRDDEPRDIKSHREQVYNVEVSPELINLVTDAGMQNRPREKSSVIVYLDALWVYDTES